MAIATRPPTGARPAWVFGLAGLAPFVGLAALAHWRPEPWYAIWLTMLAQYGALILSFVGALHWGGAMRLERPGPASWAAYAWGVMPALIGWASLQFPVWSALRMQAGALVLCVLVDRSFATGSGFPPWLMNLRYVLTFGAAASLVWASAA